MYHFSFNKNAYFYTSSLFSFITFFLLDFSNFLKSYKILFYCKIVFRYGSVFSFHLYQKKI